MTIRSYSAFNSNETHPYDLTRKPQPQKARKHDKEKTAKPDIDEELHRKANASYKRTQQEAEKARRKKTRTQTGPTQNSGGEPVPKGFLLYIIAIIVFFAIIFGIAKCQSLPGKVAPTQTARQLLGRLLDQLAPSAQLRRHNYCPNVIYGLKSKLK